MVTIPLSGLSIAYMAAAVIISTLTYLAKRNQKQGWRKQRNPWFGQREFGPQPESDSAHRAIAEVQPLEHFSDLARLQNALVKDGVPCSPEVKQEDPAKKNVLA